MLLNAYALKTPLQTFDFVATLCSLSLCGYYSSRTASLWEMQVRNRERVAIIG